MGHDSFAVPSPLARRAFRDTEVVPACVSTLHDTRSRTDWGGFTVYFLADQTRTLDQSSDDRCKTQSGSLSGESRVQDHTQGSSRRRESAGWEGGVVSEDEGYTTTHDEVRDGTGGCFTDHSEDHSWCHACLHEAADVPAEAVAVLPFVILPATALTQHDCATVCWSTHNDVYNGEASSSRTDVSDTCGWAGGTATHHYDYVYTWSGGTDEMHTSDTSSLNGANHLPVTLLGGPDGYYPLPVLGGWVTGSQWTWFDDLMLNATWHVPGCRASWTRWRMCSGRPWTWRAAWWTG